MWFQKILDNIRGSAGHLNSASLGLQELPVRLACTCIYYKFSDGQDNLHVNEKGDWYTPYFYFQLGLVPAIYLRLKFLQV